MRYASHRRRDVVRLERDRDVGVPVLFEHLDVAQARRAPSPRRCGRATSPRSGASEPIFTPTRIGIARALAASTTSATFLGSRMLPGLRRSFATPASIAAKRHLVVEVDVGDDRNGRAMDDRRQARRIGRIFHRHANDLAAFHRQAVDLLERRIGVRGIGRRHGLHDDGMVAADPNALGVGLCRSCSARKSACSCAARVTRAPSIT